MTDYVVAVFDMADEVVGQAARTAQDGAQSIAARPVSAFEKYRECQASSIHLVKFLCGSFFVRILAQDHSATLRSPNPCLPPGITEGVA